MHYWHIQALKKYLRNKWMSFPSNYLALLNHTEVTINHDPKPFLLCATWLNLIFLFPFSTATPPYTNDCVLWPKCKYHFGVSRPLQALTLSLHMPAILPSFLPSTSVISLSSMFSFRSMTATNTQESLPQKIALQFDINPLITTLCLVSQPGAKSTWPQCDWLISPACMQEYCAKIDALLKFRTKNFNHSPLSS